MRRNLSSTLHLKREGKDEGQRVVRARMRDRG